MSEVVNTTPDVVTDVLVVNADTSVEASQAETTSTTPDAVTEVVTVITTP